MKKLLLFASLFLLPSLSNAATSVQVGDLKLNLPLVNVSGVYLYDIIARETLLGAETRIASYKNLTAVLGAVTDMDGTESIAGVPFAGVHVIAPQGWFSEQFTIGLFYGRDFKRGQNISGLKASMKLW